MQYPLKLSFKIMGLAPQIYVTDAGGGAVFYVKQKLFKLKEAVKVYTDSSQSDLRYEIKADRVLDFSAKYHFTDPDGTALGAVGRQGMRSIFRATYDVFDGDEQVMSITEEAVWKRMLEGLLGGIPLLGFIVIMLINPTYIVKRPDGKELFRLIKEPAFFGGKFSIKKIDDDIGDEDETKALLSMLMMTLLERSRG
jgi:uncharacterized protein YxjI